jgi:hypothetical protein
VDMFNLNYMNGVLMDLSNEVKYTILLLGDICK